MTTHNPLAKEPYATIQRQLKHLHGEYDGEQITVDLCPRGQDGFTRGFCIDETFCWEPQLRFSFAKNEPNGLTTVSMTYSFESNEVNFLYYKPRIQALKKRCELFYLPTVSGFSFTADMDMEEERYNFHFDAIVPRYEDVEQTVYSLCSLIISILSFED